MSIVLIGALGCGKSTIGRKLADQLWKPCVDVDEQIVRRAGKTIRDIFDQDGEKRFRDLESEVIKQVSPMSDQIIALGGGSLLRDENRDVLKAHSHQLIYLRCEAAELFRRIKADPLSGGTRPSLTQFGGDLREIELLVAQREPTYRDCKAVEIDVTRLSPEDAVKMIVKMV